MKEFLNITKLGGRISLPDQTHPVANARVLGNGIEGGDPQIRNAVDATLQLPSYKDMQFLRQTFLKELKGKFTPEELIVLLDALNGVLMYDHHRVDPKYLAINLDDFEILENGASRHGADMKVLIGKIQNLSTGQLYFLIREIEAFWDSQTNRIHLIDSGKLPVPMEMIEFIQNLT